MNFMKNLKIGKKLIVTFGVIIILFLISLMVSIVSLNNSGKNVRTQHFWQKFSIFLAKYFGKMGA